MTGILLNEVRVFQSMIQMLEGLIRKIKLLTMEDTLQADKGSFGIIILIVILITGYQNKGEKEMKFPEKIYFVKDNMGLDSVKHFEATDQGGLEYHEYIHVDSVNTRVKLIKLQQKYIKMLGDEIDSLVMIAHLHGWESKNIEAGEKLREQMKKVKKEITEAYK